MDRHATSFDVVIANGTALATEAFYMTPHAIGLARMPGTWTAASLGFKVAEAKEGTFLPLYDDNGNLVQIDGPTASKAYTFPAEVAAGHWVKLWSQDGAGNDTNQGAERTVGVDLKA